jgi:hypothetical protein
MMTYIPIFAKVNLHFSDAEVSAYFTPKEWWNLGPYGIIWEMQQVYKNFIRAIG